MPVRPRGADTSPSVPRSSPNLRPSARATASPPISINRWGAAPGGERGAGARGANPAPAGANPHTKRPEEPIKAPARSGCASRNPRARGQRFRGVVGDPRGRGSDRSRSEPARSRSARRRRLDRSARLSSTRGLLKGIRFRSLCRFCGVVPTT